MKMSKLTLFASFFTCPIFALFCCSNSKKITIEKQQNKPEITIKDIARTDDIITYELGHQDPQKIYQNLIMSYRRCNEDEKREKLINGLRKDSFIEFIVFLKTANQKNVESKKTFIEGALRHFSDHEEIYAFMEEIFILYRNEQPNKENRFIDFSEIPNESKKRIECATICAAILIGPKNEFLRKKIQNLTPFQQFFALLYNPSSFSSLIYCHNYCREKFYEKNISQEQLLNFWDKKKSILSMDKNGNGKKILDFWHLTKNYPLIDGKKSTRNMHAGRELRKLFEPLYCIYNLIRSKINYLGDDLLFTISSFVCDIKFRSPVKKTKNS